MTSLSKTSFDARTVTDKRLVDLINDIAPSLVSDDQIMLALRLLREDNHGTVPLIKKLVCTGSATSRMLVAVVLQVTFSEIVKAHATGNDYWQWNVDGAWHPSLASDLKENWIIGNVVDETGTDIAASEIIAGAHNTVHGMNSSGFPFTVVKGNHRYWRGVIALYLSNVTHRSDKSLRARAQTKARYDFYGHVDQFIRWAGKHPDINAVISTAKERKIVIVKDLKAIMQQAAVPAVSKGIL